MITSRLAIVPVLWTLASALTLGACGESVADYIAKHRATSEDQLARVAKVRALAQAEPKNEWPTMRDPGQLAVCDLVIAPYREGGCDTWVIDQAQLDAPEAFLDPAPLVSYGQADWLVMTNALLKTGRFPPNKSFPSGDEATRLTRPIIYAFEWLASVRYVIVVRTDELVAPKLAPDQKSYEPGKFTGEAILYELKPEVRSLGTAPFSYAMTGDVKVRMRGGIIHLAQINKAFADGVRDALAEVLVARLSTLERPPPKITPGE